MQQGIGVNCRDALSQFGALHWGTACWESSWLAPRRSRSRVRTSPGQVRKNQRPICPEALEIACMVVALGALARP